MAQEVRFYHLQRQPLEVALPKLMERVLERGLKAVVKLPDKETVTALDQALWTFDPASFLPHGTRETGQAERQLIYLTTNDEAPNGAEVLVLVNGAAAPEDLSAFERCLYMFDGNDSDIVAQARADWTRFKAEMETISYWQQKREGGWQQMA